MSENHFMFSLIHK